MFRRPSFTHCILFLYFFSLTAYAQDLSSVKIQLDAMFSGLDKSKVPTGYLWDTAVNLVDGETFNGASLIDSNYVDRQRMCDMIRSINSASVWADTLCINNAISRIDNGSSPQAAIIGVLFKPYNYIVANAIQDNLVTYSNQVVSDKFINNVWQNPYGESILVGHFIGNERKIRTSVNYTIQNIDSLSTQSFTSIQFDAGDGQGYRNVSFGIPFSVYYPSNGYKETKLKLITGGNTYLSHSIVNVISHHPSPSVLPSPDYEFHPIDTTDNNGNTYSAMVTYKKTATFDNPLIVAEGFDPWPLYDPGDPHSYAGFTSIKTFNGAIRSSLARFDVYYVDWYNYGADINVNAMLLEKVIRWVNEQKTSGNANVVLGQSMGGLIARSCLSKMESKGMAHDTRLFISHDSPYRGVNISPGIQYAYRDLCQLLNVAMPFYPEADTFHFICEKLLDIGNCKSVKQMLPVYLTSSGQYDNTEFLSFQESLDNRFPNGDIIHPIENVAIVNGGKVDGGNNSMYSSGDKILHASIKSSDNFLMEVLLASVIPDLKLLKKSTGSSISLSYDLYPFLSHGSKARSLNLIYLKTFKWRYVLPIPIISKTGYNPTSGVCFDNYTSSYYSFGTMPDTLIINGLDSIWSLASVFNPELEYRDSIQFVPTASALNSTHYGSDFYTNPASQISELPFDSYIVGSYRTSHAVFSVVNIDNWLNQVLSEIHVPPVVFNGDTLKTRGTLTPFTWTSSNTNIATVSDSIVHYVSDGLVEFKASLSSAGQIVTKTRKAIVGYPPFTLSLQQTPYGGIVQASVTDLEKRMLVSKAVDDGILNYRWGIKTGSDNTVWRVPQSCDTIHVNVPSPLDSVTVYMQWVDARDSSSTISHLVVLRPNVFYSNIDHCEVRPLQGLTIIENPTHSFPAITSLYGHYCLTLSAVHSASLPTITSITIDGVTFPVSGVHYLPGYGSTVVIYAFDILFDPDFHDIYLSDPFFKRFRLKFLNCTLNDSDGPFQNFQLLLLHF